MSSNREIHPGNSDKKEEKQPLQSVAASVVSSSPLSEIIGSDHKQALPVYALQPGDDELAALKSRYALEPDEASQLTLACALQNEQKLEVGDNSPAVPEQNFSPEHEIKEVPVVLLQEEVKLKAMDAQKAPGIAPLPSPGPLPLERTFEERLFLGTRLVPFTDLQINKKLGSGNFGSVFEGQWGSQRVALKQLDAKSMLIWEIARLSQAHHPRIVSLYGGSIEKQEGQAAKAYAVLELCPQGDLRKAIKEKRLSLAQRWQIALEVAEGLAYIHKEGIVHRDLKPENVLLDEDGHAKLADLGVSQADVMVEDQEELKEIQEGLSDPVCKSPEELIAGKSSRHSTPASDMYAYGLLLWELFTGQRARSPNDDVLDGQGKRINMLRKILSDMETGHREPFSEGSCPASIQALILSCWQWSAREDRRSYIVSRQNGLSINQKETIARRPTAPQMVASLKALASEFHSRPVLAKAVHSLDEIIHPRRAELRDYLPPYSTPYSLEEDPDSFWPRLERPGEHKEKKDSEESQVVAGLSEESKSKEGPALFPLSIEEEKERRPKEEGRAAEGEGALESQADAPLRKKKAEFKEGPAQEERKAELQADDKASGMLSADALTQANVSGIDKILQDFVGSDSACVMVVFGDAGLGKSLSLYHVGEELRRQLNQALSRVPLEDKKSEAKATSPHLPIFLNAGLSDWRHGNLGDAIEKTLMSPAYGLSEAELTSLTDYPLLVLLDGYDELQKDATPRNLAEQIGLARFPNAKLLATCRRHTVPREDETALFGVKGTFSVRYLLPFSTHQLITYSAKSLSGGREERERYQHQLKTPALRALLRTPLVLKLFTDAWPVLKDYEAETLNRAVIYEQAIRRAVEAHGDLLETAKAKLTGRAASLADSFYMMAEECAALGFQTGQPILDAKTLAQSHLSPATQRWLKLINEVETDAMQHYETRQASLSLEEQHRVILKEVSDYKRLRVARAQQFLNYLPFKQMRAPVSYRHRSFYEYFLARAMTTALQAKDQIRAIALLLPQAIQDEPAMVQFFYEQYVSQPHAAQLQWQARLEEIVVDSRTKPAIAKASANAATLLNCCGVSLAHKAWSGVQLQGAVLSYGAFAYSDLRGANFRGATLIHTLLHQADLSGADLRDVQWGEFPWLMLEEPAGAIAYHPTRPWVAVAQHRKIVLLDTESGERVGQAFIGHTDWVTSIAFSPDGRLLTSVSDDQSVRLWDVAKQAALGAPLTGHTDGVNSVAFSPDGRLLASGSKDKSVRLWDVAKQAALGAPLTGHTDGVNSVAFSPDGRLLTSGSRDKSVRLWDVAKQMALDAPLTGHESLVNSVAFSLDGRLLASVSDDKSVRLWDVEKQMALGAPLIGHKQSVGSVAFSPGGKLLASGSGDQSVRLWDVAKHSVFGAALTGHTKGVGSVAFSPDGRLLASRGSDQSVRLWNIAKQSVLCVLLTGHTSIAVYSVAFSPDGRLLASGSDNKSVRLWDVEKQMALGAPLTGHEWVVMSVAFSPNGKLLASGSWDWSVRLWDVAKQTALGAPLIGHEDRVHSVAFSPDGRLLVSGSKDKSVRLWDVAKQMALSAPLTGHTKWVNSVAFSPDGKLLASGSGDQSVRLWDVESYRCLQMLQWHTSIMSIALIRPTGAGRDWLAIGDESGIVSFWTADPATGFQLINLSRNAGMPLALRNTRLVGSRLDRRGQRLLEQYEAKVDAAIVEGLLAPLEAKAAPAVLPAASAGGILPEAQSAVSSPGERASASVYARMELKENKQSDLAASSSSLAMSVPVMDQSAIASLKAVKLSSALKTPGIGLFAAPTSLSPEAQRQADKETPAQGKKKKCMCILM